MFARVFGATTVVSGIVVWTGLLLWQMFQAPLTVGDHVAAAGLVAGLAGGVAALALLLERSVRIGPLVDRRLGVGSLVETASELGRHPTAGGSNVAALCRFDAERRVCDRPPRSLFPVPLAVLRAPAAVLAAIVLLGFLPGWRGQGSAGNGDGAEPGGTARSGVASGGARAAEGELAQGAPEAGAAPRDAAPMAGRDPRTESRPESGPKGTPPPRKPEAINPFEATPHVVAVDKRSVLRANRESLVLELTLGAAPSSSPAAHPQPSTKALDEVKIRELAAAAERALDVESVTARERAFAKRFFEALAGP